MYWNPKNTLIFTETVDLQFWHANCQKHMHHFKNAAEIWLKVNNNSDFEEIHWQHKTNVIENVSSIYDHGLNQFIKIHRIGVPKYTTVSINFKNIESGKSLRVK